MDELGVVVFTDQQVIWSGRVQGVFLPLPQGKRDQTGSSKITFSMDINPKCKNWMMVK